MSFNIENFIKKLLFLFLVFLPFQGLPSVLFDSKDTSSAWLKVVSYSDEVVFIFCIMVLFSLMLLKSERYKIFRFPWDKFIFLFIIISGLSIFINRVPVFQGLFGTYDVLKNILVIYPFSLLRFSKEDFLHILNTLLKVAFILALFGIISMILAYFFNFGIGYFVSELKRLGLHRMMSLAGPGNWNYLGVYFVFFFFLSLAFSEKFRIRITYILTFIASILLTFSRQAWLGLILIAVAMKKKYIPIAVLIFLIIVSSFLIDVSLYQPSNYYRLFTFNQSLKLIWQKPVLGVGPGMFGGLASVFFESPFYDSWPIHFKDRIYRIHNIDMFWLWILAEFGLFGFFIYIGIWMALFFKIKETVAFFREKGENLIAKIGKVIQYFILALMAMGFAGGLNAAFVIFTYFAITGMYFSVYYKTKNESTPRQ